MRCSIVFLVALWCSVSTLAAEDAAEPSFEERLERFQLYTQCQSIRLIIDAPKLEERLNKFGEARLRSARLFDAGAVPLLVISAAIVDDYVGDRKVGVAISWNINLYKRVFDVFSGEWMNAATWERAGVASSPGDGEQYLLGIFDPVMDEFIASYLRVNEGDCTAAPGL